MGQEAFLGLDIGTSSVKALLVDGDQTRRRGGDRPARRVPDLSRCGANRTPGTGSRASRRRCRPCAARRRRLSRDWPPSAFPARCTARRFSTPPASRCAPRSCGTTAAPSRNARNCPRRVPDFLNKAGNLAMPGFTGVKAMWVAEHEPDIFAATRRILLPKDYVRFALTGEAVSENVRRRGHPLARHRRPALERGAYRRDRFETFRTCRRWSRVRKFPPISRRASRRPGGWRGARFLSPAAAATMRLPPWAWGR